MRLKITNIFYDQHNNEHFTPSQVVQFSGATALLDKPSHEI